MAEFINTIELLGDDVVAASIVEKTITEFNDNKLKTIGFQAFKGVPLISVNVPSVTYIDEFAFYACQSLTTVDLTDITFIGPQAFHDCIALKNLILRGQSVCTIHSTGSFYNSPIRTGGGTVYVPQGLIESYQTADGWAELYEAGTCSFVAIEGSQYE